MSDELDRLRAWAAGEHPWEECVEPYDPRPAVLALIDLLAEVAEELSLHGWGDFHYGSTGQEPKVAALVARARAALQPAQADPNT